MHTKECEEKTKEILDKQKQYVETWPNYCRECDAHGSFSYPATREDPESFDFCSCIYEGRCPRCGNEIPEDFDEDIPCPNCDWNWGKNASDTKPFLDECGCNDIDVEPTLIENFLEQELDSDFFNRSQIAYEISKRK
jgi:hypothetical protein